MTFRKTYFLLTILLLAVEISIALFAHDKIIRPYGGDLLVVMLLYCFVKSFSNLSPLAAAAVVLAFAFTVEFLQLFSIVDRLGLQHNKPARIIIGSTFEWADLLLYTAGIAIVLLLEYRLVRTGKQKD